jgi:hypothetical protein
MIPGKPGAQGAGAITFRSLLESVRGAARGQAVSCSRFCSHVYLPDKRRNRKSEVLGPDLSGYPGGLNRSTQHSSRTPLTLKTNAGIAR